MNLFKKNLIFILSLFLISLISCKKVKDEPVPTSDNQSKVAGIDFNLPKDILPDSSFICFTKRGNNRLESTPAGGMPIYRYYNPSLNKFFYTNNINELGGGNAVWNYNGIAFYTLNSGRNTFQYDGSNNPMWRFYGHGRHFYTSNYYEGANNGYRYEGQMGITFTTDQFGYYKPVYRYNSSTGYFYTANYNEIGSGNGHLYLEGVAFYVLK